MSQCKFCGREDAGNAGDYYHYHDCWSADVVKRIAAADPNDQVLKAKLLRELNDALYVGD